MEFIEWYLDKHYIISTLLTPILALIWAVYKGLVLRGIVAFMLCGCSIKSSK